MEKEYKSSIKGVRLTQEEKSIVESIQKEQQLSDFSKAVCYILHDYLSGRFLTRGSPGDKSPAIL